MTNSKFKLVGLIVFIGFIATLFFIVLMIMYPDSGQFHDYADRATQAATLTPEQAQINIYTIIVDNFFIVGYSAIFYGLYLIAKESDEFWAKLGLIFGFITVFTDLIENGFVVSINNGIAAGFQPDNLVWSIFWTISAIKDISSYMCAFLFVVLLAYSLNVDPKLRVKKAIFIILLGSFSIIGSLGLFSPLFLQIRSALFVIDLLIASILFYTIE